MNVASISLIHSLFYKSEGTLSTVEEICTILESFLLLSPQATDYNHKNKTNSVALSPQANYTDWSTDSIVYSW
jgi:hypothetical protein